MDTINIKLADADFKAAYDYLKEMINTVGTHETSKSLIAENGHYLRLESGLTIVEKTVVDEEATNAAKAEREAKIANLKAKFSDDGVVDIALPADMIAELKAKYGDEFVDVAMLPDMIEQKDEEGNTILDPEGNPVMMPNPDKQQYIVIIEKDENGNPVINQEMLDADKAEREAKIAELKEKYGDSFVDVAMLPDTIEQKDEEGNTVLDDQGNPVMIQNPDKNYMILEEKKDENGNVVLDEKGEPIKIYVQNPMWVDPVYEDSDKYKNISNELNPMWVDPVYDIMKTVPTFDSCSNFHLSYSYPSTEKEEYTYYTMEDYEEDVPDYEMREVDVPDVEWREVDVLDENGQPVLDEEGNPRKEMKPFELETTHKEMREVESGTTHKETRSRAVEHKEVRDKPNRGCFGGHDVTHEQLNRAQAKAKFVDYLAREDVKAAITDLENKINKKIVIEVE